VRFPRPVAVGSIAKLVIAMLLGLLLTGLWGTVEMECSRATSTCEVREWHSVMRRTHSLALADIVGVRVTQQKANKGGWYGIVWLDTKTGPEEVTLSSISPSPADATRFANELRAFLSTPGQPTFRASMSAQLTYAVVAGFTWLLVLLGGAAIAAEIVLAKRGSVVRIDDGRRVVSVPPFGDEPAREVPLAEVVAVAIDARQAAPTRAAARDPYYVPPVYLALVTRSGERIAATPAAPRDHDAFDTDAARARLAAALGVPASATG
jgi:hypothetical protein